MIILKHIIKNNIIRIEDKIIENKLMYFHHICRRTKDAPVKRKNVDEEVKS